MDEVAIERNVDEGGLKGVDVRMRLVEQVEIQIDTLHGLPELLVIYFVERA